MHPGSADKRPGFRNWYARRLYLAFAWLTTCLLSGVLIAAILEFVGLHTAGLTPLLTLTVLYFVGLLAFESFRRFWSMLAHAQRCANAATCSQCGAYGRFDVQLEEGQIPAICRGCGHRWRIR
jgi:ABC-type arginine/histidine transport system permease subunit